MNTPAMNSAQALRAALEKLRNYNVDIRDGRINYRPEDHIAVIDRALLASPNSAQPPEPAAPTDHLGFFGIRLETIYRRHRVPFAVTVEIDNAYDILVRALATTRPLLDHADDASRHETERPG